MENKDSYLKEAKDCYGNSYNFKCNQEREIDRAKAAALMSIARQLTRLNDNLERRG